MTQKYVDMAVAVQLMPCGECGSPIALSEPHVRYLRRTHKTFYCPNGHRRHFPGKSDVEELRERLARAEEQANAIRTQMIGDLEYERARTRRMQGKLGAATAKHNRTLRRVGAGVCPHCRRNFQNLRRHMTAKHPESSEEGQR